MKKYKQVSIQFDERKRISLKEVSISSVLTEINAKYKDFDVREVLSMIVYLSKEVFTTKYICQITKYSRQTISEIHNMKYTIHSARGYIYYMTRELKKLGYNVPIHSWHELYAKIGGY